MTTTPSPVFTTPLFPNVTSQDGVNCTFDDVIGMRMALYGILPAAGLGIVGNVVAFWVWHAETNFSATPFLFKWLAMCDIFYLTFNVTFIVLFLPCCENLYWFHAFVTHIRNLAQIMSVYTTLLVAITRWMAVCMPLKVSRFLTKRSVAVCCLVLGVWCLVIELIEVSRKHGRRWVTHENRTLVASHEILGYVLPWFLLLVFSLHLIWTTHRKFRASLVLHEDNYGVDEVRFRRLTLTVLCVAMSSFVAYPVGVIGELVAQFHWFNPCDYHYYDIISTLGGLLQVINAGINVVFYWAFVSRFRELANLRVTSLLGQGEDPHDDHCSLSMYTTTQRLSVSSDRPHYVNGFRRSPRGSLVSAYGTTNTSNH